MSQPDGYEGIAIIGMSGRFPGARNIEEYWRNLKEGVEGIRFFSDEELAAAGIDAAMRATPGFVGAGGALDDIELFDAGFFGFSARDAEILDPQHRIFLECAWESLENAGYNPETYPGLIGVYAGAAMSSYLFHVYANLDRMGFVDPYQIALGNDKDHLTTQVSYKLNLRGPSVAVQTACSTSLVAVSMACQSLLSFQCDMALAGGVAVNASQRKGYMYQPGGISSPDGHCRTFDAQALGTVPGNGVGIVVLKRLSEAIEDGDSILAVIKGSATNNDGSLKVGYTAPSVEGQAQVIAMAQAVAGVDPRTITYIEAHGTATPLGDPIELAALNQVFQASTSDTGFCAIGSVKSNLGHLDPAAGVAGLIKTVLAMQHKMLPPSLHYSQPNPAIDFANSPFYVISRLAEWKAGETPRRAGVSSFGIGGTNSHVVMEESPEPPAPAQSRPWQLLVLSARTDTALETATRNLAGFLRQHPEADFADVAYTCQVGRKAFPRRRAVICRTLDPNEAIGVLETGDARRLLIATGEPMERPVIFMFSGQGTQYVNMARELYQVERTFREQVDLCSELLKPHLGFDLREALYPAEAHSEEAARRLDQTALAQPALFVIEYALAMLWLEWGVQPQALIGHSIGEYTAACLAGVFSLEDALALVAARGRLMQSMPPGAMLAVPLPEAETRAVAGRGLAVAAVNSASSCVVSGPFDEVDRLETQLRESGLDCRRLHTSHAFHSPMMDPILEAFGEECRAVRMNPPKIPFLSNVSGAWISEDQATDPDYWVQQLRSTVRFADGLKELVQDPDWVLLEVGPGQTLIGLAAQHPDRAREQVALPSLRPARSREDDLPFLLRSLGRLWTLGVPVDWAGFHAHEKRRRIPLPAYPFERERYWIDLPKASAASTRKTSVTGKREIAHWYYSPSWKRTLPSRTLDPAGSRWLVFCDAGGLGARLVERLKEMGCDATSVTAAARFARHDDHSFSIDVGARGDYQALLDDLRAAGRLPDFIVHLWGVTPNAPKSLAAMQTRGFYSLLYLAQSLGATGDGSPVEIGVVANHLHEVLEGDKICPGKATVLGISKVIPQEHPRITCRTIDAGTVRDKERTVDLLLAEFTRERFASVVAYRGNRRWAQTFEPMRLDETPEAPSLLRKNGVYLITGGLGNIGLTLAKYLARTVQAKLVLAGRSAFPEPPEWDAWIASHDETDAVSRKIRSLRELEELGAEVMTASADVSDARRLKELVDRAVARFGQIHGVIHGAGRTSDDSFCPMAEADREMCERHFQPKAHGLLALEKALDGIRPDFYLQLSSLSAVLGGLGFAAYASANAFLDALSVQRNQEGEVPWISVNWDGWDFSEEAALSNYLLPHEGAEAFHRILHCRPRQPVVVSTQDLESRVEQWLNLTSVREPKEAAGAPETAHSRPNLSSAYTAPRNPTEETIAGIWQQLLGLEKVGVHDNFFELGGHSLLGIQLVFRLRAAFQIEVSPHRLFEAPTIAELAESIDRERKAPELDEKGMAELLELVEGLSESEVREMLARQEGQE
ncbi:MAG: SDR family oxidoreductase [Acidobacteria bacterium]|nr:SDR family oxidoreductase [Acidobacteriota bacterium]